MRSASATISATVRRDRIAVADAISDLDQRLDRRERKWPGFCAQGECEGRCPGAKAIGGAHCPECKRLLDEQHCELDTLKDGTEIVRVECPCGEITEIGA